MCHPSEIRGSCLMKFSSETFQHLLYFYNKLFLFFISSNFWFYKNCKVSQKETLFVCFLIPKTRHILNIHVTFAACRGKRQIHGGKICRSKTDAANCGKNQQKFEKFISIKHWFLIKNVIFVKEDVVIL